MVSIEQWSQRSNLKLINNEWDLRKWNSLGRKSLSRCFCFTMKRSKEMGQWVEQGMASTKGSWAFWLVLLVLSPFRSVSHIVGLWIDTYNGASLLKGWLMSFTLVYRINGNGLKKSLFLASSSEDRHEYCSLRTHHFDSTNIVCLKSVKCID